MGRIPESPRSLTDVVRSCGITVLRNQMLDAEGLQIVGLDDLWANRFNPQDVLRGLDANRGAIALSHNPDTVDLPVWGNYEGWILAGHTHGGQCKPPFLPPPVLPVKNRRYTAGEFELAGNRRLYISRGVGHSDRGSIQRPSRGDAVRIDAGLRELLLVRRKRRFSRPGDHLSTGREP